MTPPAALLSAVKQDWQTPPCVLERVREAGPIVLDPCTVAANPVGALTWIAPPDDGLAVSWRGLVKCAPEPGLVFVNSPFGRELLLWVDKCAREAAKGVEIIMLTPARPDTRWFTAIAESANAIAFWRGRITFVGAPAPAPFPVMLSYWGGRRWDFARAFADVAAVCTEMNWTAKSAE